MRVDLTLSRIQVKLYLTILMIGVLSIQALAVARAQSLPNASIVVDNHIIERIKGEESSHSQIMDTLGYLTDVSGARLTGSPGFKLATQWTLKQLQSWGVENAHVEPWGPFGRGWSLESFTASMIKPTFMPLIAYPKAWSPGTAGTARGSVIYLDAKNESELARFKGKLKDAIVLFAPPRDLKAHFEPLATRATAEELLRLANAEPTTSAFQLSPTQRADSEFQYKKWQMVYAEGAALVLQPGRGDGGTLYVTSATVPLPTGAPFDKQPNPWAVNGGPIIPQVMVAAEHYNRMVRLLAKGIPVEVEIGIGSRYYDQDLMSHNLIAEIPGTDLKDEVVMVGGCFDSWHAGTGATDNAAGAAVALEVVRILHVLGIKPRRTIRLGLWGGEEQGILGSRAYVAEHFGRPQSKGGAGVKPEYEKLSGYFNLDDGTGRIRGIFLQGNEAVRPIFRAWLAPFADLGAGTLSIANAGPADYQSFDEVGLPGFMFIRDDIELGRTQHTNMDFYDHVQEDDLKQAATVVASIVYHAAMLDQRLPRK